MGEAHNLKHLQVSRFCLCAQSYEGDAGLFVDITCEEERNFESGAYVTKRWKRKRKAGEVNR